MASGDSDAVPFAVRTHTLVPRDIAFARDDIRRRNEAFESRSLVAKTDSEATRVLPPTLSAVLSPSSPALGPAMRTYQSTLLSVYSQTSCDDENIPEGIEDTVTAVYDLYNGFTLYELGYGAASDEAVAGLASICLSSFDEESFLRVAEHSLGW